MTVYRAIFGAIGAAASWNCLTYFISHPWIHLIAHAPFTNITPLSANPAPRIAMWVGVSPRSNHAKMKVAMGSRYVKLANLFADAFARANEVKLSDVYSTPAFLWPHSVSSDRLRLS